MRHIARAALAAAMTLGLAGAAFAAPATDTPPPPPAEDGSRPGEFPHGDITKADFLRMAEARFDKLDTNHDGVLTEVEMKAGHDARHNHPPRRPGGEPGGPQAPQPR